MDEMMESAPDEMKAQAEAAEQEREFLEDILAKFKRAEDFEREDRRRAAEDLSFRSGEGQWPDSVKIEREQAGQPCLTINRVRAAVKQVVNEARRNRPAIKVVPVEDSDKDKAEIIAGMVRQIESESRAQMVYLPAFDSTVAGGFRGSWRVVTRYCDDEGFDQEIRLLPIQSPFAVYWDPDSKELDRADAKWCFVVEEMSKALFKERYPDKTPSDWTGEYAGELRNGWMSDRTVRVAEYWCIEEGTERVISQLENGETAEGEAEAFAMPDGSVARAVNTRTIRDKLVVSYKVSGHAVLENAKEFPSKHIPIISCEAPREWEDGRLRGVSLIRDAKDPQRMYNYWQTTITEKVALAPKAPFLVTPKQIEGLDGFWKAANRANLPYLPFNPDPSNPGAPQRQQPAFVNAAELQQAGQAIDDIKATTGIYDASLGARSNETSGRAIMARQQEGDTSTYDYMDALSVAIERTGRIVVDMIPRVYNTRRAIRILNEDETVVASVINDSPETELTGRYDVRVEVGPSYSTKRMEARDSMMQFVQAVPKAGEVGADVIARNMDWPGADELAKRFKKTLPPGIADEDPKNMTPEQQQEMQSQAELASKMDALATRDKIADVRIKEAQAEKYKAEAEQISIDAAMAASQMQALTAQLPLMVQQLVMQSLQDLMQGEQTEPQQMQAPPEQMPAPGM